MNFAQRIILIIAFLAIAAMAIFPPWVYVHDAPRYKRIERPAGYHLISGDHTPQDISSQNSLGLEQVSGRHSCSSSPFVSMEHAC